MIAAESEMGLCGLLRDDIPFSGSSLFLEKSSVMKRFDLEGVRLEGFSEVVLNGPGPRTIERRP